MLFGTIYGTITANSEAIGKTLEALIHLTIAMAIGWGIYKKYKAATTAGLVLAIAGFVGNGVTRGFTSKNSIIMLADAWMFLQSTRGIFAYHKMNNGMILEKQRKSNNAFN